jgi:NCS2 family nucleobase:cation symporter-2
MGEKSSLYLTIFGDYDYKFLFMPRLPWSNAARKLPPFFGRNDKLAVFPAIIMGLQHALAMISGITVVPYVIAKFSMDGFPWKNEALYQYVISAALISCGIMTFFQVMQFRIPFTRFVLGTGLISVLGTSFTFLPIFEVAIRDQLKPVCMEQFGMTGNFGAYVPGEETRSLNELKEYFPERTCDATKEDFRKDYFFKCDPSCADAADLKRCASELCGDEAYGKMLGSCVLACFLEVFIALLPAKTIQRIFPPIVQATCVMLIGIGLTGTGMKYWGGGVVCSESDWRMHPEISDGGVKFPNMAWCSGNGEVVLEYGSPEYIGLGFSCLAMLIFIELFGSPFAKNANVILALLFGYFVSAVSRYGLPDPLTATAEEMAKAALFKGSIPQDCDDKYENCTPRYEAKYVTDYKIEQAAWLNFLWVKTFPLGLYGPAIPALMLGTIATTVETIGDLASTYDVSKLKREGEEYDQSVQGGLFADGFGSVMAALFTVTPNTTYSGNTGIIALTRCASRRAGLCCAGWLFFFGIFSKLAGWFSSIPDSCLGGVNTFLWCQVFVAGINILASQGPIKRRERFVVGAAMAVGISVAMNPHVFNDLRNAPGTNSFWPCSKEEEVFVPSHNTTIPNPLYCDASKKSMRDGIMLILGIPYLNGTMIAMILNAILPGEDDDELAPNDAEAQEPIPEAIKQ